MKEYDIEDEGRVYHIKEYSNGSKEKYIKPVCNTTPSCSQYFISDEQLAMLEMQANIQYLVDLAEINMEV